MFLQIKSEENTYFFLSVRKTVIFSETKGRIHLKNLQLYDYVQCFGTPG